MHSTHLALEIFAIQLIALILAIVILIAAPSSRDAFPIPASEFGLGAFAVFPGTERRVFITSIATVVGMITGPQSKVFSQYSNFFLMVR